MDKVNKSKTWLVVVLFILIILISGYIIFVKATSKSDNKKEIIDISKNSNTVTELSLSNPKVIDLLNLVDDNEIEYQLYKNANKILSWDTKSLITTKEIMKDTQADEELNFIDKDRFDSKFKSIFGTLRNDKSKSNLCNSSSYNSEYDNYQVNYFCTSNNSLKLNTYLKNVTVKGDFININKYYLFTSEYNSLYDIYASDKKDERNLVAVEVAGDEISKHILYKNEISYVFRKGKGNNYYLYKSTIE